MYSVNENDRKAYIRPALREIGFDIEDICQNESIVDGGTEPGWDD
jgi:hypothetical protein